jgi:hypothetical protein
MNIIAAIDDPNLLGASLRDPDSWKPWRALLAAAFGLTRPSCFASARPANRACCVLVAGGRAQGRQKLCHGIDCLLPRSLPGLAQISIAG